MFSTTVEQSIAPVKDKLETDKMDFNSKNFQEALEFVVHSACHSPNFVENKLKSEIE